MSSIDQHVPRKKSKTVLVTIPPTSSSKNLKKIPGMLVDIVSVFKKALKKKKKKRTKSRRDAQRCIMARIDGISINASVGKRMNVLTTLVTPKKSKLPSITGTHRNQLQSTVSWLSIFSTGDVDRESPSVSSSRVSVSVRNMITRYMGSIRSSSISPESSMMTFDLNEQASRLSRRVTFAQSPEDAIHEHKHRKSTIHDLWKEFGGLKERSKSLFELITGENSAERMARKSKQTKTVWVKDTVEKPPPKNEMKEGCCANCLNLILCRKKNYDNTNDSVQSARYTISSSHSRESVGETTGHESRPNKGNTLYTITSQSSIDSVSPPKRLSVNNHSLYGDREDTPSPVVKDGSRSPQLRDRPIRRPIPFPKRPIVIAESSKSTLERSSSKSVPNLDDSVQERNSHMNSHSRESLKTKNKSPHTNPSMYSEHNFSTSGLEVPPSVSPAASGSESLQPALFQDGAPKCTVSDINIRVEGREQNSVQASANGHFPSREGSSVSIDNGVVVPSPSGRDVCDEWVILDGCSSEDNTSALDGEPLSEAERLQSKLSEAKHQVEILTQENQVLKDRNISSQIFSQADAACTTESQTSQDGTVIIYHLFMYFIPAMLIGMLTSKWI